MNPIIQFQRDIARYEADSIYYQDRAEHCRREAALLRQELEEEQTGSRTALENARERATISTAARNRIQQVHLRNIAALDEERSNRPRSQSAIHNPGLTAQPVI